MALLRIYKFPLFLSRCMASTVGGLASLMTLSFAVVGQDVPGAGRTSRFAWYLLVLQTFTWLSSGCHLGYL
jgi:hypothetical protein